MGIYNRDYMRFGGSSGSVWAGGSTPWPPVCKWLIITTAVVFVLQLLSSGNNGSAVENWLALEPASVLHGQVWRLFTSAFCHDSGQLMHVLINMLILWWFGKTLEQQYGSREFLLFYLAGALCASLAFIGIQLASKEAGSAIGASGAVMAVLMLYAANNPRQKIYIWFVIPVEIRWLVAAYVLFDLFPVLQSLAGNRSSDGIAHSAHLGGLAFGFCYWKFEWNLGRPWERFAGVFLKSKPSTGSKKQRNSGRKIIQMPGTRTAPSETAPTTAEFEKEVDRILQKIVDKGNSHLTEKERQTLVAASERIKERDC
ncbi:MAG: rhomboid family intramembrane serine protease [Verrucomicrobia bacterium]|nr:rhomboid family intramembrane serine protease [Verrucomicrobiota bacterium]